MTERRETEAEMNSLLSIYGEQMEQQLFGINRAMSILLENGEDLALMGDDSESEMQYAMIRIKNRLWSTLRIETGAEWGVIVNSVSGAEIQAGTVAPSLEQKLRMGTDALAAAAGAAGIQAEWEKTEIEGEIFLCRRFTRRNQAIQLYVRENTLLRMIRTREGDGLEWAIGSGGAENPAEASGWMRPERLERTLSGTPFRLICGRDSAALFGRLRGEIAVLISMTALLLVFTMYLRRSLRQSLFQPMNQLESDMRKIQAGDYEMRVATDSDAQEFQQMTGTLNQLLEEVLALRIRELERQLDLQEANQKYIRLQLRPHFFLNAMATVSALSAKNKNQEIQTYIDALSKNIRYMFSAGMHTVPVREELVHVENYLKMQELKYPDCVFSYVEMPEELAEWPIPQMIIHTVVENEYKYAVSRDRMLMLLIRVSREAWQGQEVLLIEIEDDGQGYPQEVIDRINTPGGRTEGDGTRVGLWSIKTMMEMMYDQAGLLELANQSPHGAIARIRVPREAIHEITISEEHEELRLKKQTGERHESIDRG